MAIVGRPRARTFHKKFKFTFSIGTGANQFRSAAFQKIGGLKANIAKIEYHEGGALIPNKSPGRVSFDDLTCERGACFDRDTYDWFVQCANARTQRGLAEPSYKRDGDLIQWDRDDRELRRWRIFGMWPDSFEPGDWDNEADEVVIEKLTLAIDFFELVRNVE